MLLDRPNWFEEDAPLEKLWVPEEYKSEALVVLAYEECC
jgi:hypothetical protein